MTKRLVLSLLLSAVFFNIQAQRFYENPILGGDFADPSVIRVGNDFYLTHSSFEYYPGLLIWHSTDLVHWKRVCHALTKYVGSVWAPDIVKHKDTWYIYFPASGKNWVVTAPSPEGPWSEPIDLKVSGIDPGHVVDAAGKRHLYLSGGKIVPLADDGLSVTGPVEKNYNGWDIPEDWVIEGIGLESPKSTVRNGYFYLVSAMGGTAGPATSHMVIAARAKSPYGPFENSPYNPIIRTKSKAEKWWSQVHGTLVDDVSGKWWIVYHSYEKGFHTLGRQTLLMPIEWTADGWFRVPDGVNSGDRIAAPAGQPFTGNSSELSDDFSGSKLGLQWQFFKRYDPERATVADGKLTLKAQGKTFDDTAPLLVTAGDLYYEIEVEYRIDDGVTAGLTLFYNEQASIALTVDKSQITIFNRKSRKDSNANKYGNHGFLRIRNDNHELSFFHSADGKNWTKMRRSIDSSGYHHNVFYGFMSLRPGIFAFGDGNAVFDNFIYRNAPSTNAVIP